MALTYNAMATANLSGLSTYTFSGLTGTFGTWRFIFEGSGSNDLLMRFNGNTDISRYGSMRMQNIQGSSPTYTWTYNANSYIYITDFASTTAGYSFAQVDLYNPQYTSASPPRAKNGIIKAGSRTTATTGSRSVFTSFMWYNSDAPITSVTFFTSGGTFGSDTTMTAYNLEG